MTNEWRIAYIARKLGMQVEIKPGSSLTGIIETPDGIVVAGALRRVGDSGDGWRVVAVK